MNRARLSRTVAIVLLGAFVSAGCAAKKPYAISDADRTRFASGLIDVPMAGRDPLILGLDNCVVWKARYERQQIAGWKATLGADWGGSYPRFMTVCTRESIHYKEKRVVVSLCAQAIGAGGGCANGGQYWSWNGERPWRISDDGVHWRDLPR